MSNSLEVLAQNRDALLLAEVAAWLHMFGKFHEEFLHGDHDLDCKIPDDVRSGFPQLASLLEDTWTGSIWQSLDAIVPEIQSHDLSIFSLIENHRNPSSQSGFLKLMIDAHGRGSSVEKGVLVRFEPEQISKVCLSTSLGYAQIPMIDLARIKTKRQEYYKNIYDYLYYINKRQAKLSLIEWIKFRDEWLKLINFHFSDTVAETRIPSNDVTLLDQTMASVAFFKAALAQNLLLGIWKEPNEKIVVNKYHWRLLKIGMDGIMFWNNSTSIGDVLARKQLISDALNAIKTFLETEYPLGMEIYRDENGSVFIVPDIKDLKEFSIDARTLENHIKEIAYKFFSDETSFTIDLSERTRSTLTFGEKIANLSTSQPPKLASLAYQWQVSNTDVCTICGLRPCVINKKNPSEKSCDICANRKVGRSKRWFQERTHTQSTTIWIDEATNLHGRLALVVARFTINDWLSGKSFNTVLSFDPESRRLTDAKRNNTQYDYDTNILIDNIKEKLTYRGKPPAFNDQSLLGKLVLKDSRGPDNTVEGFYNIRITDTDLSATPLSNSDRLTLEMLRLSPSFARIMRVWETTQKFWEDIISQSKDKVGQTSPRLRLYGTFTRKSDNDTFLQLYHTYELKIGNINLSLVKVGENEFLTVDNLQRVCALLNASYGAKVDYSTAAAHIKDCLIGQATGQRTFDIELPTGYGSPNKSLGSLYITEVVDDTTSYAPAIPILAEPSTFMMIVPADKALEVAQEIKEKYEREMSKVRNRLPMTVGIVFADRRMPLPAILESGRRMLKQTNHEQQWRIVGINPPQSPNAWPKDITLTLESIEQRHQCIQVTVHTVMGDSITEDVWYPYWGVIKDKDGIVPVGRQRQFKSSDSKMWVHVCDLEVGDEVSFTPSHFDFEFLDTAARRFEISYVGDQRRSSQYVARPYYLEQLNDLATTWALLQGLATSQIEQLVEIIEFKREEWRMSGIDEEVAQATFDKFVWDSLYHVYNAHLTSDDMSKLYQAALNGQLADVVDLYMRILKKKTKVDQAGGNV